MNRYTFPALTLSLALAIAASAQTPQPRAERTSSVAMGSSDQAFMKKAAEGGMAEVQLGQLAEKNASNDSVKQFGRRMVTDHSKMGDDLQSLAASKGVTLPSSLGAKHKTAMNRLSAKSGAEFDKEYISMMIKDHNEDIAEFRKEADSGSDPDVKAFASQALPTLQEHLRMAQDCAKQIGVSSGGE